MINNLKTKTLHYNNYEIINFINTSEIEKKLILDWRNHDNVRKWMLKKNIITYNEHKKYINSLKKNSIKLCRLVKFKNSYLGIVEFDEINFDTKTAYFGLNSNPMCKQQGIGRILEEICIYIAKEKLQLTKLYLYVFKSNMQVINLHKKYGFKIIDEKDILGEESCFMEKFL